MSVQILMRFPGEMTNIGMIPATSFFLLYGVNGHPDLLLKEGYCVLFPVCKFVIWLRDEWMNKLCIGKR